MNIALASTFLLLNLIVLKVWTIYVRCASQNKRKKQTFNFINEAAKLHSLNILLTEFFLNHASSLLLTLLKFEVILKHFYVM